MSADLDSWTTIGAAVVAAVSGGVSAVRAGAARSAARQAASSSQWAAQNSAPVANGTVPELLRGSARIEDYLRVLREESARHGEQLDAVARAVESNREAIGDLDSGLRRHLEHHLREGR